MARKLKSYEYRRLSEEEKEVVLEHRKEKGHPWHSPPHSSDGEKWYLITAANYEHQHIMKTEERRADYQRRLLDGVEQIGGEVSAWVILPNHYHLLAKVSAIEVYGKMDGDIHRGTATEWNREDATPGRKVWFRFSDREVRSEQAFFAYFNYIHGNPVKHGYVQRADEWSCSSLHSHLDKMGAKYLRMLWRLYPTFDTGKGWDDF
ncbi:MAG: transposase [Planctomycetota bacterium]|jgi:putative transposase|nr:transposase [Planctomycetota bacterium]MDP7253341.1 transposase [Planctomycetota bacterium]